MTCELGLRGYMICTECHTIFTKNPIGIGELFNCESDIALVCSEICRDKITIGDWTTITLFLKL